MQARTGDPMKAASAGATATSQSAPVAQAAPAPVANNIPFQSNEEVAQAAPAPVAEAAPAATGGASDILAMIRSRQQQQ